MPRGTRKRNFKKKKTRNKRPLKKGNNTKKRRQRRTRRRRGGKGKLKCSKLHTRTKIYLRDKLGRCFNDGEVAATDDEEYIKHHLTTITRADGLRKRGWITTYLGKKKTISEMNDLNTIWRQKTDEYKATKEARQRNTNTGTSKKPATRRVKKTAAAATTNASGAPSPTLHRSSSSISSSPSPNNEIANYYKPDHHITY